MKISHDLFGVMIEILQFNIIRLIQSHCLVKSILKLREKTKNKIKSWSLLVTK